ncbi:MAG TPA: DUF302 domain-containing protein [Alphaproteobacteria bacterium]|nr:DUF302 domain-containing protein [Alphaproteobacteria bacterium]
MKARTFLVTKLVLAVAMGPVPAIAAPAPVPLPAVESGVIRVKSIYSVEETVAKIQADVAAKGIKWFGVTDQSQLGADANIKLNPSMLVQFGNPPLGVQFLTATPYAGLDWPVRMLVFQDDAGGVWIAYTDFAYIGKRHHIENRDAQLKMASEVAASIASSATH